MNLSAFKGILFVFVLGISLRPEGCRAYFLDHFKAQHAGEIGELAIGFGKQFNSVYSLDYLHGVVREEGENSAIITFAIKNNFNLYLFEYNNSYAQFYTGVNVFHVTGLRYQASRRNNFPDKYYSVGSIRGLFYLGVKGWADSKSPHQAYFESGINDIWLLNSIQNPNSLNMLDYASLALGYSYLF